MYPYVPTYPPTHLLRLANSIDLNESNLKKDILQMSDKRQKKAGGEAAGGKNLLIPAHKCVKKKKNYYTIEKQAFPREGLSFFVPIGRGEN